jgi:hypothetical protein
MRPTFRLATMPAVRSRRSDETLSSASELLWQLLPPLTFATEAGGRVRGARSAQGGGWRRVLSSYGEAAHEGAVTHRRAD